MKNLGFENLNTESFSLRKMKSNKNGIKNKKETVKTKE